ncbi:MULTISPECIES: acyl carrier protein [Mesorhizobium]|uniref:acyl carrier protein n=1 Tax=Mesorhizobium TaxID=68287 RepID=UPI0007ED758E|nr:MULTISPECIES: acyl carrier protein [Mesorhizobium]TPJ43728.1 acyl carrier protein [Mesorhizobium sp. B2-6-6]ARP67353.1 nodulation protein NodF [Mesorhizobium sp. WSM1497]MCA0002915.1 acyl carrier protein [Mesorhizobium sp. B264B2A]MCA0009201.1 acyl carrier protein [Mesorhizobium sp. B264B1B]MCA0013998.1 acyl carrier protein [Mesorhizobium sp. B294B1A1]
MSDQLITEVIEIIRKRIESENAEGTTAASVGEITTANEVTALGIDSLGLADVLWDLEQAYGIKIEMNSADAWSDLQTVGDMVEAIRGLLNKAA